MWSGLVRHIRPDDQENRDAGPVREVGQIQDGVSLAVDEEVVLEEYDKIFWTRLMTFTDYEPGLNRKFPMGPDIVEEC